MTTYTLCKRVIERKIYQSKEDMMMKLDVFFLGSRLTQSEYDELVALLESH